jgi:hypothetical protein
MLRPLLCLLLTAPLARALVISEILPENEGGLQDADYASPGWIEIHNETGGTVNLGGWRLTDDPLALNKWTFPAQNLAAGARLVVFASGKNRTVAGQELHTNFQLNADGEYLALIAPDGVTKATEFNPFPKLRRNVSYAVASSIGLTTPVLTEGTAVKYHVPASAALGSTWTAASFNDAAWSTGATGLGFDTAAPGTKIDIKGPSFAALPPPAEWTGFNFTTVLESGTGPTTANVTVGAINVKLDAFGSGLTLSARNRQGSTESIANSASLNNVGEDFIFASTSNYVAGTPKGMNITVSGLAANSAYPVTLYAYDRASATPARVAAWTDATGGASGTLTFNGADGQLPDDAAVLSRSVTLAAQSNASGQVILQGRAAATGNSSSHNVFINALEVGSSSYASFITTSLDAPLQGNASSLYARAAFNVATPANYDQIRLRIRYDDGFFAWLNGTLIASRNAPGAAVWNSAATADRAKGDGMTQEEITLALPAGALVSGTNVLAFQGLKNGGAADTDFLLSPSVELLGTLPAGGVYYATPTPGAANSTAFQGIVGDTRFTVDRGYYTSPFNTEISCDTSGAQIRYTLDGSAPAAGTGAVYDGPISITGMTVLRAAAFVPGLIPSNVDTQSYLFRAQAAVQPANPPGWPANWGTDSEVGGTVPANYEMDPVVRNSTVAGFSVMDALEALPSLSLAMAPGDFLGPSGIYQNPRSAGDAWEKPCSIELLDTDGSTICKETCGVEIHGGSSRRPARMQKHSMRLSFKGEYGAARLRERLFPGRSTDSFDRLVLRACFTDSWGLVSWDPGRYRPDDSVYFRDVWMKRSWTDLGGLQTTSRFVHLYVNGLYWGVHDLSEKMDESFFSDYEGGLPTAWDVIADFNEVKVGNSAAWDAMFALGALGMADNARYTQMGSQYLDIPSFADYYLLHIFAWAEDWPSHNWYASRRRDVPDLWNFHVWDQEIALDNTTHNRIGASNAGTPGQLFQYLRTSPEFRLLFADRVQKHCFNGGVLSLAANQDRWSGLAAQLDKAIVAESARWGDTADETPYGTVASKTVYTREADWVPTVNNVRNSYLPALYNNANSFALIPRLRANSLYPSIDAPAFGQHGGIVPVNFALTITAPSGSIYYTTDGTDPRQALTGNVTGTLYSGPVALTETATVRARARNGNEWSALTEAQFIAGTPASAANLVISEICYNPPAAEGWEFIELQNIAAGTVELTGVQFTAGIGFAFAPGTVLSAGARLVLARDAAAFTAKYPGITLHGTYTGSLDNSGEQLALTDSLGADIRRFIYGDDHPWPNAADGNGHSMVLIAPQSNPDHSLPENWRASVQPDGNPGAGDALPFAGNPAADSNGDGYSDLFNYAMGDPPVALLPGAFTAQFNLRAGADDARVVIETSNGLNDWSPAAPESLAVSAPVAGIVAILWTPPPGEPRRFARARVTSR